MFLCHLIVDKSQKVFVGADRRHLFWMRVVRQFKVASFSPLRLKSNNIENIKYAQKKKKYFGSFYLRKQMLIRFVDFEIFQLRSNFSDRNYCPSK